MSDPNNSGLAQILAKPYLVKWLLFRYEKTEKRI